MRYDGTWTVYIIQHWVISDKVWCDSSLDHFGYPHGFSSSFPCWQQTGINGTFEELVAFSGLRWIREKWPKREFRVVRRTVSQQTEVAVGSLWGKVTVD